MVLVTGATGFIGSAVIRRLVRDGRHAVLAAVRNRAGETHEGAQTRRVSDLLPNTDWQAALRGVDVVVHASARVHVMSDASTDPLSEYRRVNTEGTLNLARQAASAGARRFIFLSSIKVNGESTPFGQPFRAEDLPAPADEYGISKMEAESGLRAIAAAGDMEVTIVRPPLVYGPGVKANFRAMMRWIRRGVPLPLGLIHNKRSLVGLDNLVDLLVNCIERAAAANQTFLVADGEDLSTTELLRRLGAALGVPVRLILVPGPLIQVSATLLGKQDIARRLCGSLQVDISRTRAVLGWAPPVSVDEGLRRAAEAFLRERSA